MRSAMKVARDRQPQRISAARPGDRDVAEMQAEALFQLGVKLLVRQRDDARGLAAFLRPDDGRAIAGERQNGERPGRQKMLLGAAAMRALMRDRRDNARLPIIPAEARDARALANGRARAVGGGEKFRGNDFAIGQRDVDST